MKISLNWLRDFVDFELSAEELAHGLTMLGLEVEGIEYPGRDLDKVVVGRLLSVEPHPDADRLSYCAVDTGAEKLDIVCGAKNISVGDMVPVALVGAKLPNGLKIKQSKIRGLVSNGMLCSAKELELDEDADGIYLLPGAAPLGAKLSEYLHLEDVVLDIGLTPNRGDCLSILGIAREVAALCRTTLKMPEIDFSEGGQEVGASARVEIEAPELCPRYAARVIKGVTIRESPLWLRARLRAVGLRPINNVVDVTNYVLWELGHPLHAFDYDQLAGHKIVVKRARDQEKFTTLDGVERELDPDDLVICDGEKAVALAGVMGGENSEVSEKTANILLESAFFKPQSVHRTSKKLGLESEASHRFARGADIEGLIIALERAAQLISQLAGGEIARGRLDVYPGKSEPLIVTLRPTRVNKILGAAIEKSAIEGFLRQLSFRIEPDGDNFRVRIPAHRHDLTREIDLIEEIARLYGYDNIPSELMGNQVLTNENRAYKTKRRLKDIVLHFGLDEIVTYSFIDPDSVTKLNLPANHVTRKMVQLANPLTEKQAVLRTSLVPGILATLCHNEFQQNRQGKIFELGKVFRPRGNGKLPSEPVFLAGALSGKREVDASYSDSGKVDFFDLKAIIITLADSLDIPAPDFSVAGVDSYYHPGMSAVVLVEGKKVGQLGALHPVVQENFQLTEDVYLFELNLDLLLGCSAAPKKYRSFARYPAVNRDLALVVAEEKSVGEITDIVWQSGGKHLEKVELFDVYRGQPIPQGHKSLAFSFSFRSREGTLTDLEVNDRYQRIVEKLTKLTGAEVRQ